MRIILAIVFIFTPIWIPFAAADVAILTLKGHSSAVYSVSFSPGGRYLATGGWKDSAKIWDLSTGMLFGEYDSGAISIGCGSFMTT